MVSLASLWLPILVAAVLVFVTSSVVHMALPWHKNDFRGVPDESALRSALAPVALPAGDYMVPHASSSEEMRSPEFQRRFEEGPVIVMTVIPPGPITMGKQLGLWFLYCIVVSVFGAYLASRAVPAGGDYLEVFRFAGATAFVGYGLALWQNSIWYRRSWATTFRSNVDALLYGLITGGTFGWLWPTGM